MRVFVQLCTRADEFIEFLRTVPGCAVCSVCVTGRCERKRDLEESAKSQCCPVLSLSAAFSVLSCPAPECCHIPLIFLSNARKDLARRASNLLRRRHVVHPIPRNYCDWKSAALHDLGEHSPHSKVRQQIRRRSQGQQKAATSWSYLTSTPLYSASFSRGPTVFVFVFFSIFKEVGLSRPREEGGMEKR